MRATGTRATALTSVLCALLVSAASGDPRFQHYVRLEDSEAVEWAPLAAAFARLDISEPTAAAFADELNARGAALVVEGSRARCDKAMGLFGALGMNATVLHVPASPPGGFDGPNVVELDEHTLRAALGGGQAWLIQFYAPWCGHCKQLRPAFAQAAAIARVARFGVVNCDSSPRLCQAAGVKGYPTLKYGSLGALVADYSGGRTAPSMVMFAGAQAAIAATVRTVGRALRPFAKAFGLGSRRK